MHKDIIRSLRKICIQGNFIHHWKIFNMNSTLMLFKFNILHQDSQSLTYPKKRASTFGHHFPRRRGWPVDKYRLQRRHSAESIKDNSRVWKKQKVAHTQLAKGSATSKKKIYVLCIIHLINWSNSNNHNHFILQ